MANFKSNLPIDKKKKLLEERSLVDLKTAGQYDANKGGFATSTGKTYPTTNPDFKPNPNTEQIKFNNNGSVSITTREGKTFDLSKDEYNVELGKAGNVTNKNQALDVSQQKGQQVETLSSAASNLYNVGQLTPAQQGVDLQAGGGAIGGAATGAAALGGALAGVKAGAATGAIFGGPVGAIVGGAIGGIAGAIGGAYVKVSAQDRQDVKNAYTTFTQSKSNIGSIISALNAGRITPEQAVGAYNEELSNLYAAERLVKYETSTNLKKFLSSGADELAKVEAYKRQLPFLEQELRNAIITPNPNYILNAPINYSEE